MDKTKGFYPFDGGSIPSGGTERKETAAQHVLSGGFFWVGAEGLEPPAFSV